MFEKIPISDMTNEGWLNLRKMGIGGSDAGAVCGVNPYSSAIKVFRDKTSDNVEEINNEAIRIGHDLEYYVADRFSEATGLKVRRSNYMYRSIEHPFMIILIAMVVIIITKIMCQSMIIITNPNRYSTEMASCIME